MKKQRSHLEDLILDLGTDLCIASIDLSILA